VVREAFHGDLAQLGGDLAAMCRCVAQAMRQATQALLTVDLPGAEQVLSGDRDIDARRARCEQHAYGLLALQAPVARDLRTVLAAIWCVERVERMGDLAAHVADTARFAHPEPVVPAELESTVTELGAITAGMAERLAELVGSGAEGGYAELERVDGDVGTGCAQPPAWRWWHGSTSGSPIRRCLWHAGWTSR
jgi:phosphate transport system protein